MQFFFASLWYTWIQSLVDQRVCIAWASFQGSMKTTLEKKSAAAATTVVSSSCSNNQAKINQKREWKRMRRILYDTVFGACYSKKSHEVLSKSRAWLNEKRHREIRIVYLLLHTCRFYMFALALSKAPIT